MESAGSLPHSQVSVTCPYPEPAQSRLYPTLYFLKIHLNIILLSSSGTPKWSPSLRFPTKTLYISLIVAIRATCHTHLILDLITRKLLDEEYRSFSFSLCNFLHSPVTSSHKGPINLQSTLFSNTLILLSFPRSERPSFTPKQNNKWNHRSVYFNLFIFRKQTGIQKILQRITASIP